MYIRTVITGIILTAGITAITYYLGAGVTLFLIGAYNVTIAILLLVNKETYNKLSSFINPYRYKVYNNKDDEFKAMVKPGPVGNLMLGAVFIFMGFRSLVYPMLLGTRTYAAVAIFMVMSYFIETIILAKSKTWFDYKKYARHLAIAAIALAFFMV